MARPKKSFQGVPVYEVELEDVRVVSNDELDQEDEIIVEELGPTLGEQFRSGMRQSGRNAADNLRNARQRIVDNVEVTRDKARERITEKVDAGKRAVRDKFYSVQEIMYDVSKGRMPQQLKGPQSPLHTFKNDIVNHRNAYLEHIRKSELVGEDVNPKESQKKIHQGHDRYAQMMMLSCLAPLRGGVNLRSITTSVGMATTMWLLSPNFRQELSGGPFGIRDKIKDQINGVKDSFNEKLDNHARGQAELAERRGKNVSRIWQRRLDRIDRMERGDRELFTPESAALTHIGLAEQAYEKMRQPNADVDKIRKNYEKVLSYLYVDVQADGLTQREVTDEMQKIVGSRLDKEPHLGIIFSQLSHGEYDRTPPQKAKLRGSDKVVEHWDGRYVNGLGEPLSAGAFTLREPMSHDDHIDACIKSITSDMAGAARSGDMEQVNKTMLIYGAMFGLEGSQRRHVIDNLQDDPLGRSIAAKAERMRMSMTNDGLNSDERRKASQYAFMCSMDTVAKAVPEVEQYWSEQLRDKDVDWRDRLSDYMRDPMAFADGFGREDEYEPNNAFDRDYEDPDSESSRFSTEANNERMSEHVNRVKRRNASADTEAQNAGFSDIASGATVSGYEARREATTGRYKNAYPIDEQNSREGPFGRKRSYIPEVDDPEPSKSDDMDMEP